MWMYLCILVSAGDRVRIPKGVVSSSRRPAIIISLDMYRPRTHDTLIQRVTNAMSQTPILPTIDVSQKFIFFILDIAVI